MLTRPRLFAAIPLFILAITFSGTAIASNMPNYGKAPTPMGYLMYCLKFKADCKRRESVFATEAVISLAKTVQTTVNRNVRPVHDIKNYRKKDHWTIATNGRGDCEDFSLTKRALLLKAGVPASSLLLASAINQYGEPHMVLILRTQHQDYVLDNLYRGVKKWQELPYKWMAVQDMQNPMHWKKPDSMMVAQLQRVVR